MSVKGARWRINKKNVQITSKWFAYIYTGSHIQRIIYKHHILAWAYPIQGQALGSTLIDVYLSGHIYWLTAFNAVPFTDDTFKCIFLMKMLQFQLKFYWNLFLSVPWTIFQHWFRWLGADQRTSHYLNQWWLVYWHTYVSLGPQWVNTFWPSDAIWWQRTWSILV